MKRLLYVTCGVLLAGASILGMDASASNVHMYKEQAATVLTAQAINATAYTGWVQVATKRTVAWEIAYTNSAGSAVTMSCQTSDDRTTTNGAGFDLHVLYDSATQGTSTSVVHTWSNAVAGDEDWTWSVANLPHDYVNCAFDGTGADGSDVVTVKHRRITP